MALLFCRGDLPEELSAKYAAQRKAFDNLQKAAASLAECLDMELPHLESSTTRLKGNAAINVISNKASLEPDFALSGDTLTG